jgi:hypothetical protein
LGCIPIKHLLLLGRPATTNPHIRVLEKCQSSMNRIAAMRELRSLQVNMPERFGRSQLDTLF